MSADKLRMAKMNLSGMTDDEFIRRSLDAAFTGDFDRAFDRRLDEIHSVGGSPAQNGREVRARCGQWLDTRDVEKHLGEPPTCATCRRITEELDAEQEAAVLRLMLSGT